jgi:hypothetical protein
MDVPTVLICAPKMPAARVRPNSVWTRLPIQLSHSMLSTPRHFHRAGLALQGRPSEGISATKRVYEE